MKKLFISLICISMIGFYYGNAQIKLDSSLVAKYYFNGNVLDDSGHGNDGIIFNATLTTDRFGKINKAFLFDGTPTKSYIDIGNLKGLENEGSISISFWIYKYFDGRYEGFLGKWHSTPFTQENTFLINNGLKNYEDYGAFLVNFSDNTGYFIKGGSKILKNSWTHIVCTFDSSNGKITIYKNGLPDNTATDVNHIGKKLKYHNSYSAKVGNFGKLLVGDTYDFMGKIDDIRIYKRAISLTEIDSLYKENNSTAINEIEKNSIIEIYPNPAMDNLNLFLNQSSIIEIYNSEGRIFFRTFLKSGNHTVDLKDIPRGFYFVKSISNNDINSLKFYKL